MTGWLSDLGERTQPKNGTHDGRPRCFVKMDLDRVVDRHNGEWRLRIQGVLRLICRHFFRTPVGCGEAESGSKLMERVLDKTVYGGIDRCHKSREG